jgi:hypothetical protein
MPQSRYFVFAALMLLGGSVTAQAAAILPNAGFNTTTFPANDDESVGPVNTGLGTLNFFGLNFDTVFVNNNGNVTFTGALGTFTPDAITAGSLAMLAPFWGDVDTAGGTPLSNTTKYGNDVVDGHNAFGVNWVDVGFYDNSPGPARNSFQLVVVDRTDTGAGNFDFMFNYDKIQWESGEASGSDPSGCGGTPAHAGWTNGAGTFAELPGSGVHGGFTDPSWCDGGQSTQLTNHSLNSDVQGRYLFNVREGVVTQPETPTPTPVPEPGSLILLGTGVSLIGRRLFARKR